MQMIMKKVLQMVMLQKGILFSKSGRKQRNLSQHSWSSECFLWIWNEVVQMAGQHQ